jgi:glucose/arabinose dehydrogenase
LCRASLPSNAAETAPLQQLLLPPGFQIELITQSVPNARQMALSDAGVLYVGTRRAGNVYAVTDWRDPAKLRVRNIATGLKMPSGVAWHAGSLYVAALDRVLVYPAIDERLDLLPEPEILTDTLPDKRHHGWKYLSVGPDGALYLPIGAPCNICESADARFASIQRLDINTGSTSIYASGVRNSVGLAWHPDSGELWFSDNGRDMLGDDVPADEINRVKTPGGHYGYPFIHAGTLADPKFGKGRSAADYVPPELLVQAHAAVVGLDFYTGARFPSSYHNALFIAEHGSWNRSTKVGYQVSVVLETTDGLRLLPFVSGWLQGQDSWGRPNDVLVTPAGDLLISDDQLGAIYRVTYQAGF